MRRSTTPGLDLSTASQSDGRRIRKVIPRMEDYVLIESMHVAGMRALRHAKPSRVAIRRLICGTAAIVALASNPSIALADDDRQARMIAAAAAETQADRNLPEEWLHSLDTIDWHSLPFRWALTTRRGSGRRQIAIFSDPNCPYCRRFEKELEQVDDITVHVFMYPVIRAQSVTQSKSVWCSRNRVEAWRALMLRDVEPTAATDCNHPIEELLALGRKLKVSMTPTWFLPTGERYKGAFNVRDIMPLLDKSASR